jgi:phenylacetate-CoA ligase
LVEVVNDGRSCTGEQGEIVITDLRNFAMPMIRYRIRDVGRIKESGCTCGRNLPLMELSGGRVTDFLVATNGNKVSGIVVATYVITNLKGIRQIQFIQDEKNVVVVNLVKGQEWSSATQTELVSRLRRYLGSEMRFNLIFSNSIAQEASGKYRFAICNIV